MMDANHLLSFLRNTGLSLLIAGQNLIVEPRTNLNDEMCALIKNNKESLINILLQEIQEIAGEDWQAIKNNPDAILLQLLSLSTIPACERKAKYHSATLLKPIAKAAEKFTCRPRWQASILF